MRMNYEEDRGIEQEEPVSPGFLIEHLLMPKFQIDKSGIAEIMNVTPVEAESILSGQTRLTDAHLAKLQARFGSAVNALLELQIEGDFFAKNLRRPNMEERKKMFSGYSIS